MSKAITKEQFYNTCEIEWFEDCFKGTKVIAIWIRDIRYLTPFTKKSEISLAKHHVWRTMERSRM